MLNTPLSEFFNAFWEAVDSRALSALHRVAASAAFLSSLLECTVFLIKRMRNDGARFPAGSATLEGASSPVESASGTSLIQSQFSRVWEELASGKLKVEQRAAARLMAQTFEGLYALDPLLLDAAWNILGEALKSSVGKRENPSLVSAVLKVFYDRFRKEDGVLRKHAETLMNDALDLAIEQCEGSLSAPGTDVEEVPNAEFALMLSILDRFRDGLFVEGAFCNVRSSFLHAVNHSFELYARLS